LTPTLLRGAPKTVAAAPATRGAAWASALGFAQVDDIGPARLAARFFPPPAEERAGERGRHVLIASR